ncbi:MAG TPA: acetate--CoA ligase family protein [Anaerohalosphaeraceae bacterium]|nr:acetate--CoA ligase family protein [Anaerohalosphaeraceae bacterium]HOM75205.1 acetate--CoA ligase family protein [Anaerohalosphaeraceae bacterium]HPC64001.1 acetate--CoA ligase family protein [Anaerohalosphaeraceae bacterium]HRV20169.1 acetate--CoA ligase family protein [Anaerohalosphaeraceae bacterium]
MTLDRFFNPQSVAIVGASRQPSKVGYEILAGLLKGGYPGKIFPVNPTAPEIQGLKAYPDLKSIGQVPDLVVLVVSAKLVPQAVQDCANLGVKAVIIISSGFKEAGPEGAELEKSIVRIAKTSGLRIIGPNCIGLMVPSRKLNVSFGGDLPQPGSIGYFSQSGSLLAAIVDMARDTHLGFSKLISIGNKADVDELTIIRALGEDAETEVIAGYLETIADGDAFIRQAESISRQKPILLLKAGFTAAGARAASSHTGRLAETESAYECVFERAGVIRCESIKDQFDYARAFAYQPLPKGSRVAVIANAGGAGIMATDAIEREGLQLAQFSEETRKRLSQSQELSRAASINNPIDLLGDALSDRYEFALQAVLEDPNVDTALVLLSPHAMTECTQTAHAVVRVANQNGRNKPILACFLGAGRVAEAVRVLRDGKIPPYDSPESAVRAVKTMSRYAEWKSRPPRVVKLFNVNRRKVERIIERHIRLQQAEVGEMEAKEILEAYGFVTPEGGIAATPEQAANIANQIGYPVVMKVWSPDILHKADVGGVKTNINSDQEVLDVFDLMMYRIPRKVPQAKILGIYVEKMCTGGREVILGMNRDPRFGPLMMFGMGGRLVEVLEDVVFYPAPLTAEEARQMLVRTKTYDVLKGTRGQEGVDIGAIAEGLQRLSQLATEFPQIKEIDINPYVVGREGTTPIAVDAMMTLEQR